MSHAVADNTDKSWKAAYGVSAVSAKEAEERKRVAASREKIDALLKKSIFQHAGAEPPMNKFHTWFDAKVGKTQLNLTRNIRVNQNFFALTWDVVGGASLAVFAHGTEGRVDARMPCIRGQKSIGAFDLSTHDPSLVAIGSLEGDIKLWRVPEGGFKKNQDEGMEVAKFTSTGKVTSLMFHPYISGVLVSVSQSYEGCTVQFWDISDEGCVEAKATVETCQQGVADLAFGPNGRLIGITGKDGKARIIDPRLGEVEQEWEPKENGKDVHLMFVSTTRVLTCGFGAGNRRTMSLWDLTDLSKPLASEEVPQGNNALSCSYDEDSRILFITNIGGSYVHLFQVHNDAPFFEQLDSHKGKTDFASHAFFPRRVCDVRKVEVARSVKIDQNKSISTLKWVVPRKRLEFFQDDLYPDSREHAPLMNAEDFFSGHNAEPKRVSQQPEGMKKLSEAPAEELSEQKKRYLAHKAKIAAPKKKGVLGHESAEEVADHFRHVAKSMPKKNRWDAAVDNSQVDVDEDEWD